MSVISTELDSTETTLRHARLIRGKYFLNRIYREFYEIFRAHRHVCRNERNLELGSGGGFIQDVVPHTITSDVIELPGVDRVISAESLPFDAAELANIFLLNVLHHLPDPERFFDEATRVLMPGGRVVMIEPARTLFSRFIYQYFHHEACDWRQRDWSRPTGGRLSNANSMLPWIIFRRDRAQFDRRFPGLHLERYEEFMPFRYLLSGGLSYRQCIPDCCYTFIAHAEASIRSTYPVLGLFATIILERV
jgi:SAM-dependent methyltransferase